jgi:hypothetical protein
VRRNISGIHPALPCEGDMVLSFIAPVQGSCASHDAVTQETSLLDSIEFPLARREDRGLYGSGIPPPKKHGRVSAALSLAKAALRQNL